MLVFDTHLFYKRLQEASFSEKQAETITDLFQETQEKSFENLSKDLSTKEDLQLVKQDLKQVKSELELKIEQVKSELGLKMEQIKVDTIKWVVTLLLAQTGILATLMKIL